MRTAAAKARISDCMVSQKSSVSEVMFSQAVRALCRCTSTLPRGIMTARYPQATVILRTYRNRAFNYAAEGMEDVKVTEDLDAIDPAEGGTNFVLDLSQTGMDEVDGVEKTVEANSEIALDSQEVEELEKATESMFSHETEEEASVSTSRPRAEKVTERNFEDEFFRMTDATNRQFIEDDVNDTLRTEGHAKTADPVTFVQGDDTNAFFDRILSLDSNCVLSESEKKRVSIVKEDKKEEIKEVKRSTWFNFMPAKELPEGPFGTYSPDQIFNSLEFDLLSRNMGEVYKYEKDDMLLTEEVLRHAKMPEEVKAPVIPNYPNFEEYARRVTFAVNRNGDYNMEDKQRVVDALQRIGELKSDVDESPKIPFKPKKYM